VNIALYCPKCADRVHKKALALAFDEILACACGAKTKAGQLLTDEGKTLVDYLAHLTLKVTEKAFGK